MNPKNIYKNRVWCAYSGTCGRHSCEMRITPQQRTDAYIQRMFINFGRFNKEKCGFIPLAQETEQ